MKKSRTLKITVLLIVSLLCLLLNSTAQEGEWDGDFNADDDGGRINLPHEPDAIWSIAWSPDGTKIAYGLGGNMSCNLSNNDYSVHIVDATTLRELNRLNKNRICPSQILAWSADSDLLLMGDTDSASVWDVDREQVLTGISTGTQLDPFRDHGFSPDGKLVASVSESNYSVRVWNPLTGIETNSFNIGAYSGYLAWSPDSTRLAIVSDTIEIWDVQTGQQVQPKFTNSASRITWSPDGTKIAGLIDLYGQIQIFDAITGQVMNTFDGHTDTINQIAWSRDNLLASASNDGTVKVWDVDTGEELAHFDYEGVVYAVSWSQTGDALVFGGARTDLKDAELVIVEVPYSP